MRDHLLVTLPVDMLCRSGLQRVELEILRSCLLQSDGLGWVVADEKLARFMRSHPQAVETLIVAGYLEVYPNELVERTELDGRLSLGPLLVGPASHREDFTLAKLEAFDRARKEAVHAD